MHPKEYENNPEYLTEFQNILSEKCTFVDNWHNNLITPNIYRVYGKKHPAREAARDYVSQVKAYLKPEEYVEKVSIDVQNTTASHQEWQTASHDTTLQLDHRVKEP